MDNAGRASIDRNNDPRGAEQILEGNGSFARTPAMRGDSKRRGFTGRVGFQRLLRQRVKFSGVHIRFELMIPSRSVKRSKPLAQRGHLLGREALNLLLDFFNFTHSASIARTDQPRRWASFASNSSAEIVSPRSASAIDSRISASS